MRPNPHIACERGFSLMEAIVATFVATVAVLGLAHSFGLGHGLIDRYSARRAALGEAQRHMALLERLALVAPGSNELKYGGPYPDPAIPFSVSGVVSGYVQWRVSYFDDPTTPSTSQDLKRLTVYVVHEAGGNIAVDSLSRLIPK